MPNKVFHSTFATLCVTVLSIMMAFYDVLVINLGEQIQIYRENTINNLQQIDVSVESFSQITEPLYSSSWNWTIKNNIENNVFHISMSETWTNSPTEVLIPRVNCIMSNYTEAVQWDEEVRDWLESRNVTRARALDRYLIDG